MADFNPLPNPYDKQTPTGVYWSITDVAQKYGGSGILCPSKLKDTAAIDVRVDLTQLPAGKKKEIEDKMVGTHAAVSAPAPMDISGASTASASVSPTPSPAAPAPGSYPLPSPPAAPKLGGASSFEALAAALAQITLPSHVRFLQVSSAGPTTVTTQTGGRSRRRLKHKSRQRKTRHRRRY